MRIFRLLFCTQKVFTTRGVERISRMLIIVFKPEIPIHSNRSSKFVDFLLFDNSEPRSFLWNSLGKHRNFHIFLST